MEKSVYEKIIQKKEFSNLPKKDVELAFSQFERRQTSDEDKIKLTRDLLRKVFSVFGSEKLLTGKKINPEFVLKKHISTRERLEDYNNIYSRIFSLEFSSPPTHPFAPSAQNFSRSYSSTRRRFVSVEKQAIIRELHVYGQALELGDESSLSVQHKGLGKWLLSEAEKIIKKNKIKELKIISGVGVREYYRKLGYKLDKEKIYMMKKI